MRSAVFLMLLAGLFVSAGCSSAGHSKGASASDPASTNPLPASEKILIKPETGLSGRVVKINQNGRFIVINFPPGQLPAQERRFIAYRKGFKVAEVRISGPQLDDNVIADVITGDAEVGDEIREN